MKPRILLSGSETNVNYENALTHLGAEPFASYLPEVSTDYDGLILCGGGDIHPSRYGEEIDGSKYIDEPRDQREMELLDAFVQAGKPILGICRGLQMLNVYFGGSLIQDLPNAKDHSSGADFDLTNAVTAEEGSIVGNLYGESFTVNSSHHQAIKALGKGLKVTMRCGDVIEGVEHENLPIFAVQWHPERMCFEKAREDTVDGSKLLMHFLDLCK